MALPVGIGIAQFVIGLKREGVDGRLGFLCHNKLQRYPSFGVRLDTILLQSIANSRISMGITEFSARVRGCLQPG